MTSNVNDLRLDQTWPVDPEAVASLPAALDQIASLRGDCEYLRFPHLDVSLTFEDVRASSERLAHLLTGRGVAPGDRVAIMLDNTPAWPLFWFAVLRSGASVVPVNARYRHADISHVLRDSAAAMVVTSADRMSSVTAAAEDCAHPCPVFDAEVFLRESDDIETAGRTPLPGVRRGDLANLQYTSGTTGFPKACMLTHDYWLRTGTGIGSAIQLGHRDVAIMAQAWSYVDQPWMTTMCVLTGATHVVLERFSASGFWPAVRRNRATVTYVLGAMPVLLAKQQPAAGDAEHSMRIVLCSAIPVDMHQALETRFGVPWREAYGSTETGIDLVADPTADETVGTGALGTPRCGKQVTVVDDLGVEQPLGVHGEIVVQGQPMMLGYWNHPEATRSVLSGDRYRTGDLGFVDGDGYIHHAGRIKDMIRRGGENIAAGEVEATLSTHPAVHAVAVVGIPDEIYAEIPKAFVIVNPGFNASARTAREIIDYAQSRLAAFKVPTVVEFRKSFPMTPSQRVEKRKLLSASAEHRSGADIYELA